MDKRESYINGVRMYSDKLDEDFSRASQKVDYYKKVEKTITKTVIKDGSKPSTQKVVSTTIIKDGNNPEQVSKKIYSSKNYGGSQILQNSQKYGSSGKYKPGGSSQISQSIVKSSYSKSKMSFTLGFNFMVGNGRGVRESCSFTCSMRLL